MAIMKYNKAIVIPKELIDWVIELLGIQFCGYSLDAPFLIS